MIQKERERKLLLQLLSTITHLSHRESFQYPTTKRWLFPLNVGHSMWDGERKEVSLVSVFRHRMCWGLWAEIPTCTVNTVKEWQSKHSWCTSHATRNGGTCTRVKSLQIFFEYLQTIFWSCRSEIQLTRMYAFTLKFKLMVFDLLSAVTLFTVFNFSFIHLMLCLFSFSPSYLLFLVFLCLLCCDRCVLSKKKKKNHPIEETSLGYVSTFAMISFFFASCWFISQWQCGFRRSIHWGSAAECLFLFESWVDLPDIYTSCVETCWIVAIVETYYGK